MRRRVNRAAAILLVALLGISGFGAVASPTQVAADTAAAAAPTIAVTAQPYGYAIMIPGGVHFVQLSLTLHITGSGFVPGSRVSLAFIDTSTLKVLARSRIQSEAATTTTLCSWGYNVCNVPNPSAGTVDATIKLNSSLGVSNLRLLYRAPHVTGMREVAAAQ